MDLSNVRFTIKKGDFVVDVDRGYIGYGRVGGEHAVERLSHFIAWSDVPSVAWLRSWCRDFLGGLVHSPEFHAINPKSGRVVAKGNRDFLFSAVTDLYHACDSLGLYRDSLVRAKADDLILEDVERFGSLISDLHDELKGFAQEMSPELKSILK